MVVTATEFKEKLGHYLDASQGGAIVVTRNGKPYAKLVGMTQGKSDTFSALRGILPADTNLQEIKESRMKAHESHI